MFTWDDLVNKEIPNSTYANFNWCTCLPGMTWLTRKFPIALMLILIGVLLINSLECNIHSVQYNREYIVVVGSCNQCSSLWCFIVHLGL